MIISPSIATYVTLDLIAWQESGALELSPKFQRRPVWKAAAKSQFIDTLLRGFPVPPIHVRLAADSKTARREIIDGQQRLRTVFDFFQGKFRLGRNLTGEWAGKEFSQLTEEQQDSLRMYKFYGFQYEGLEDSQVLEVFARINTYSAPLSPQELRNGKYFGSFKTAVYASAYKHLEFWRRHRLFTENAIARMQEAELLSELAVLFLDGLQDKKTSLDDFYRNLDDEWEKAHVSWTKRDRSIPRAYLDAETTMGRVERVLGVLAESFGDVLVQSEFRRIPLFYSLFAAVAHREFGLPGQEALPTPMRPLSQPAIHRLREVMVECSELLSDKPDVDDLSGWKRDFLLASSRQTDNFKPRQSRLDILWSRARLDQ